MADFFPWISSFETGIAPVDSQHRRLVGMLNELFDAMNRGEGNAVVGRILDGLVDYTSYHFKTEEELFAKHGYPEAREHIREHAVLRRQVLKLRASLRAGRSVFATQLAELLKEWLRVHILQSDKNFGVYLLSKGIHGNPEA
jgi:hemerythrin-like metal-binding protein